MLSFRTLYTFFFIVLMYLKISRETKNQMLAQSLWRCTRMQNKAWYNIAEGIIRQVLKWEIIGGLAWALLTIIATLLVHTEPGTQRRSPVQSGTNITVCNVGLRRHIKCKLLNYWVKKRKQVIKGDITIFFMDYFFCLKLFGMRMIYNVVGYLYLRHTNMVEKAVACIWCKQEGKTHVILWDYRVMWPDYHKQREMVEEREGRS